MNGHPMTFNRVTSMLYIRYAYGEHVYFDRLIVDIRILIHSNKFNGINRTAQKIISEVNVIGFIFRFIKDLAIHVRLSIK